MQKTLILFISLISFYSSNAQNENNDFFFKTEKDSLGICYGKSLQQATWDTISEEVIIKEERRELTQHDSLKTDTIQTEDYILNHHENLFAIIDFVDTAKSIIKIRESSTRLVLPSSYEDYYTKITASRIKRKGYHTWIKKGNDFYNSEYWSPKFTPPTYTKEIEFVVTRAGTTRVEVIPAQFQTIITVKPKNDITPSQLTTLNKVCKKYYIRSEIIYYTKEKIIPKESKIKEKYILKENAKTILVPIACDYTKEDIIEIQRKLMALNLYYGGLDGLFNEYTKKAIIQYQLNNNLPIGQLDLQTLKHLL